MLAVGMVALWFCVAAVPMSLCFARCRLQLLRSAGVEGAALEQETDDDWSLAFEDVLILYADSLKSPAKGKPRDPFRTLVEEVFSQLDTVLLNQSDRIRFSLQSVLFDCDACRLGCTAGQLGLDLGRRVRLRDEDADRPAVHALGARVRRIDRQYITRNVWVHKCAACCMLNPLCMLCMLCRVPHSSCVISQHLRWHVLPG